MNQTSKLNGISGGYCFLGWGEICQWCRVFRHIGWRKFNERLWGFWLTVIGTKLVEGDEYFQE